MDNFNNSYEFCLDGTRVIKNPFRDLKTHLLIIGK